MGGTEWVGPAWAHRAAAVEGPGHRPVVAKAGAAGAAAMTEVAAPVAVVATMMWRSLPGCGAT